MDEPKERSLSLLEHKIGFALKTPEEVSVEELEKNPGQSWVKPRWNSTNIVGGPIAVSMDKNHRGLYKTMPPDEDQIVFKEMLNCYIHVDPDTKDKFESNRVAKEAAKIINGFSSLKSQIEDLKSLFIQLKKENQGTSNLSNLKGKLIKQGTNTISQKDLIGPKIDSPTKKKSQAAAGPQQLKTQVKRSHSNSKRSASQKSTFRSVLFGKNNLNGSMETNEKNSIYSSEKHLLGRPKLDLERFKNIYSRYTLGRPLEGERRSFKSIVHKTSSRTTGAKQSASKSKQLVDSNSQYFESIIGNLTKPSLFTTSKRNAEVLSLVNINNLYATLPDDDILKKKIRKKFSSPKKSADRALDSSKKGLDSVSKGREGCEDFRASINTARIRNKKQAVKEGKEVKKETSAVNQKKFIQDKLIYFNKTERATMNTKNPLHFSLAKWDRTGERFPSQDRSVTHYYSEIETDKVRSSINSDHQTCYSIAKTRNSHIPGCLATTSYLMKKPTSTSKCNTPAGQSLPKTFQSERTEELKPSDTEKQRIINHLSRMRESLEPQTPVDRREVSHHGDKNRKQVVVYREMIHLAEEKHSK